MTDQQVLVPEAEAELAEQARPDVVLPPTDLPYDDGDKMESAWHYRNSVLLVDSCIAAYPGPQDQFFVGANMFLYYMIEQTNGEKHFKGPDVFLVKDVDGTRERDFWAVWAEGGRYPDVIFELLSPSTRAYDLGEKKAVYEQVFRTREYFCIARGVEELLGWRLGAHNGSGLTYQPIAPNERGWLWSEELQVWLGAWEGSFKLQQSVWLRFYTREGDLVLLPEEIATERVRHAEEQATQAQEQARHAEEQATQAQEQARHAEEQATQAQEQAREADERAQQAEARAARLAALLREQGIEPE